jgi:hypothetical protein
MHQSRRTALQSLQPWHSHPGLIHKGLQQGAVAKLRELAHDSTSCNIVKGVKVRGAPKVTELTRLSVHVGPMKCVTPQGMVFSGISTLALPKSWQKLQDCAQGTTQASPVLPVLHSSRILTVFLHFPGPFKSLNICDIL